jgi:hypothetical protein
MYSDQIMPAPAAEFLNSFAPTPRELAAAMVTLEVMHYNFEGKIRIGHIIVHQLVLDDIRLFFKTAFELRFPIHSVVPVHLYQWSDAASCADNNSSGQNMRYLDDGRMSKHGIGCAFDINPIQNPCFELDSKSPTLNLIRMIPENGVYRPGAPGTLSKGHPLVKLMKGLGWTWGGGWDFPEDYQHFQIVPDELASYVTKA